MQGTRKVVSNWLIVAASSVLLITASPAFGQQLVEGVWAGTLTIPNGGSTRGGFEVTTDDGPLVIVMTPPGVGEPVDLPSSRSPSADEAPAANPAPIANLGELSQRDLDVALERQLAVARAAAAEWQAEDPATADKATLDPVAMAGFNNAVQALDTAGVDLGSITPADINSFELSYQDWRNPAGYYYYLFLTTGAQHWIVALSGELKN